MKWCLQILPNYSWIFEYFQLFEYSNNIRILFGILNNIHIRIREILTLWIIFVFVFVQNLIFVATLMQDNYYLLTSQPKNKIIIPYIDATYVVKVHCDRLNLCLFKWWMNEWKRSISIILSPISSQEIDLYPEGAMQAKVLTCWDMEPVTIVKWICNLRENVEETL